MIVGHTKFAPDWCFGLFKRAFRKASIGCLEDIAAVCERSSKVNYAQLVGKQDGTPIVPTYDWGTYLPPNFKRDPFKGIKKLHHMRFSRSKPGVCFVRTAPDAAVKELKILAEDGWKVPPDEMPPIIQPEGLSAERRKYLFEKIREFCPPNCQDLVCPSPIGECPPSPSPPTPASTPPQSPRQTHSPLPTPSPPPSKKPRKRQKKLAEQ